MRKKHKKVKYVSESDVITSYSIHYTKLYDKGCRSWNNSDDGYDLWGTEVSVLIDSCWAFYNGYDPDNDPDTFYGNGVGFKLGRITSYNVCYTKLLRG